MSYGQISTGWMKIFEFKFVKRTPNGYIGRREVFRPISAETFDEKALCLNTRRGIPYFLGLLMTIRK
jgi:hypothetical protein